MSVLDRKLLREIRGTGVLLLAITSIIAVGVACFVAMGSAYFNLTEAKEHYYEQCHMADFSIELKKVPTAELAMLEKLPGVLEIRPRIQSFVTVDLAGVEEPLNGLMVSLPDERKRVINDIVLREGGYFTETRRDEVIVSAGFARYHGLHPGESIHLLLNNRRQELMIVGTAISSEFVYLLAPGSITPDPGHFGVFYLKQQYAEEVFDSGGAANQVLGRLAEPYRKRPGEVLRQAEILLEPYGVFTTTPLELQASNRFLTNEIHGLRSFGMFMPMVFLAVAAVVLNVVLSRMAQQQRVIVGTWKAIGYADWQVFLHYLKFGLIVGLVGGVAGCAMGYLMAYGMTTVYRQFFEFPDLVNRFFPGTHAIGLTIALGCSILGSFRGASRVLKLLPAEAMRPSAPRKGGAILLEKITWLWRLLSFPWRMVFRNALRNRWRSLAGLFAAAMGAALLVTGFMMYEAMPYMMDFQFEKVWRSDIDLVFKEERSEAALLEVRNLPGVDEAEPVLDVACTLIHGSHRYKGGITGLTPGARMTVPHDVTGQPIDVPEAGLVMSRRLADILHLVPGDSVTILPVKGLRKAHRVPVVSLVDGYLGLRVYANIRYLSSLVGESLAMTSVQVKTDKSRSSEAALNKRLKRLPALQAINTKANVVENLQKVLLDTQWIFIVMIVLFAGVIFFGSVLNSSLVSLAERSREVATLRVLGYGPWQVGGMFLRESMLTTLLGTVIGLPLGYGLMVLMATAYNTDLFRIPIVTPPKIWIGTLGLAIIFALTAHAFVQRAIGRMDWREELNVKE